MGKTPISPLVWVSALSRESKEVTKPTSRSVAFARNALGIGLSHGTCHTTIDCHMAVVYHMAIVCHMAFKFNACTCVLSTMFKRHTALAVFDQARAFLCNSAYSKALGICRCKCAWPMYIVQAVSKLLCRDVGCCCRSAPPASILQPTHLRMQMDTPGFPSMPLLVKGK